MGSGGARARSGPAPDPEALNRLRNTDAAWHVLPITGRPGPAPEWPLPNPSQRELDLWALLWAKPQATRWEVLGQDHEVALYVRRFVRAEQPDAPVATVVVVRQLGEALGLTIPGLLRNRWQIGSQQSAPVAPQAPADPGGTPPAPRGSAKSRILRAVPSDGG
jgi:hypothetical protein